MFIINIVLLCVTVVFLILVFGNIRGLKGVELKSFAIQRAAKSITEYAIDSTPEFPTGRIKALAEVCMHHLYEERDKLTYQDLEDTLSVFEVNTPLTFSKDLFELSFEFIGSPKDSVVLANQVYAAAFFMGIFNGCISPREKDVEVPKDE